MQWTEWVEVLMMSGGKAELDMERDRYRPVLVLIM